MSIKILDFIKLESLKANVKEKLLGSSEIIESVFGRLKEVGKGQNGFLNVSSYGIKNKYRYII
ncbi:hypothetical protein QUF82_17230 [Thiotrichales bacterium HSG14]|nr:hypothetical protein [Thiotrichales bacterium HSG14]